MCAGKNRAAEILARRGFAVVDADQTARTALEDVSGEVLAAFSAPAHERGVKLLGTDGKLDRRALGALIFADPALLARHEAIIYPRINELLDAFIDDNPDSIVVINAPLLHKSPVLDRCDWVIYVDAWTPIRLFRALRRDKLPIGQIFARFSAQKNLFAQYLLKNVDIQRVSNPGSIRALEKKLDRLLAQKGY
jgi:dephospho-CoA kinase